MDPLRPDDVEFFGADSYQDIQEKHSLRRRHDRSVPETDQRRRIMDPARKVLLALFLCFVAALGFASAHPRRVGYVEDDARAVVGVKHSRLLSPSSTEPFSELLERYVFEAYQQQESRLAKRQDVNATIPSAASNTGQAPSATAPTGSVRTPPPSLSNAPSTPSTPSTPPSATIPSTPQAPSDQTQNQTRPTNLSPTPAPTPSQPVASPGTSNVNTPQSPTPVAYVPQSPTPFASTPVPSLPRQSSTPVGGPNMTLTPAVPAIPTPSTPSTPSQGDNPLSLTPIEPPTPISSKRVITTFTSTMADGGISVVTQTSFSYVDAVPTGGSPTRPAGSLQTDSATDIRPLLSGTAMALGGFWLFILWQ